MKLDRLFNSLPTYTEGKHRVKSNNTWHSVPEDEFRANIASYEQITLNTKSYKHAIIFDVDEPELYAAPDIAPYTSTFNQNNDKSHQLFLLDKPIFTKSPKQREWYLDMVQAPLAKITFLINADVNYKNLSTKNPFSSDYRVNIHGTVLGSVFDLIGLYNNDLQHISHEEVAQNKDSRYISGKYRLLVSQLIEHSMMNSKLIRTDLSTYESMMHLKAEHLSKEIGLKENDAYIICNDAIAKGISLTAVYSKRQRYRSAKANRIRWGDTKAITEFKIKESISTLLATNSKVTYKSISLLSDIPVKTLENYSSLIRSLK